MKAKIGIGVFGTFGTPNGFQQHFYLDAKYTQTLDLNPNAIELYPNSKLYSLKREIIENKIVTCFCAYDYAREYNSSRSGTFFGTCIAFDSCIVEGGSLVTSLIELQNETFGNLDNIINNEIQVKRASEVKVNKPISFEKLVNKTIKYPPRLKYTENKNTVLIAYNQRNTTDISPILTFFFDKGLSHFSQLNTLFFTFDERVTNYVAEKGLINIINWEDFVKFESDKKNKDTSKDAIKIKPIKIIEKEKNVPQHIEIDNEKQKIQHVDFWEYPNETWNLLEITARIDAYNGLLRHCQRLEGRLQKIEQSNIQFNNNWLYKHFTLEVKRIIKAKGFFIFSLIILILLLIMVYFVEKK